MIYSLSILCAQAIPDLGFGLRQQLYTSTYELGSLSGRCTSNQFDVDKKCKKCLYSYFSNLDIHHSGLYTGHSNAYNC